MSSPHRGVLADLVIKHGWTHGAELGVDKAILFQQLLTVAPDLQLIGVDTFDVVPERLEKAKAIAAKFPGRARLLNMTTHMAAATVQPASLDFVFIDADHSEAAVRDDIARWQSKVKPGGWFGGHDYNKKFPGVMKAVNAAFGKRVHVLPGSIWGVWLK